MKNKKEILHQGKFLSLVSESNWEFVERKTGPNVAVVFAKTEDNKWLFVEQFRQPLGRNVIENPAGLIGDFNKESAMEAAERELLEETGFKAGTLKYVFSGPSSSGLTNEFLHFFLAINCQFVSNELGVDGENIKLHKVKSNEIQKFLEEKEEEGALIDPKILLVFSGKTVL